MGARSSFYYINDACLEQSILHNFYFILRVYSLLQVTSMLKEARARVQTMLGDRMEELHAVAKALIQEETLSADQILDVCERSRAASAAAAAAAATSPPAVAVSVA